MRTHLAILLSLTAIPATAETITLTLQKQDGTPLENAVAFVEASELVAPAPPAQPPGAKGKPLSAPAAPVIEPVLPDVVVAQREQEFAPFVTVVQKGAQVKFTNEDKVQHNIYSFSSVEKLNFPLHAAGTVNTKSFNKEGEVELGCNIHDWMQAYLFVVDSPVFGVSGKDGKVTLTGVPVGGAKVQFWHPHLREKKVYPSVRYQPGKAVDPLRLQIRFVKKPLREKY